MSVTLVTGATGFVGLPCVRQLVAAGATVHATAREESDELPAGVVFHPVDLLAPGSAASLVDEVRPARLLHLAWIATPGAYRDSEDNDAWLAASRELFDAFAAGGGRRCVAVGTCAEYDWSLDVPLREDSPKAPQTRYARAKHDLASWLEGAAAARGVSLAWARLFFLYGPREHPDRLVPSVTNALLEGRSAECTSGTQVRDFMHVDDAARALAALLDSDAQGPVNVASGEGTTVRTVAERIAGEVDGGELRIGARATPKWEPDIVVADVRRLRSDVGWTASLTLEQGIAETVEWWRARARAA